MLQFDKPEAVLNALKDLMAAAPQLSDAITNIQTMVNDFARRVEHTARNFAGKEALKVAVAERKLVQMTAERDRLAENLALTETRLISYRQEAQEAYGAATTDALSGLLNRRGWDSVLDEVEKTVATTNGDAAVVYMDLNDLRFINNSQGHDAGDELIKRAADAIAKNTRKGDFAARVGGDEFILLAKGCNTMNDVLVLITRLDDTFKEAKLSVSVGACLRSECGTLHDACKEADKRMFKTKAAMKAVKL